MPVDPHNPYTDQAHERTRVGADFRYSGCRNSPRPHITTLRAQDGWHPDGRARFIEITSTWQHKPCTHDKRANDPACQGCEHL